MDDADGFITSDCGYSEMSDTKAFDKLLPEEPYPLLSQPNKITYQTKAGTTYTIALKKPNKYNQVILKACSIGFQSNWFIGLTDKTKISYLYRVRYYFDWINESEHNTSDKTRYDTLKKFESFLINDQGLKAPGLGLIKNVIKKGMTSSKISETEYIYLQTLLSISPPAQPAESTPFTLSNWFATLWIRDIIGEEDYLKLESPKLLFNSFRVTIATSLLYLLEQRQKWQELQKNATAHPIVNTNATWYRDWNFEFLKLFGKFNKSGDPEDTLSQLMWLDLVRPHTQNALKETIKEKGLDSQTPNSRHQNKKIIPWQRPVFFHPDYRNNYSYLEELLCAWLVACDTVQPTDIPKLKTSNYTRERNTRGRLIAIECTYYKGRAGTTKQPSILMGSDPWARALDKYMEGLSLPHLFAKKVESIIAFPALKNNTPINLLFRIWKLPSFIIQLEQELQKTEATSLFLNAMLSLEHGNETYGQFNKRTKRTIENYKSTISRPLPMNIFTLTEIKNSAVHARSDSYRAADLINYNSHTSLTENTSYLTDENKEWVNQAGRITRLVLNDLQNVVYHPSINDIRRSVHDMELRTRISKATNKKDLIIKSIQSRTIETSGDNIIIVADNSDVALYFIHYINQAEALLPKLLAARPDWVERTLITQVEWMTRTLTQMKTSSIAQKEYKALSTHLPPLFDHLLETTE
ncbi:MAG: hypothetical protein ACQEUM_05655 [Pseudomonadota bacterium]